MEYLLIFAALAVIVVANLISFRLGKKQEGKHNLEKNERMYEKIESLLKKRSREVFISSEIILTPDFFNGVVKEIKSLMLEGEIKETKTKEIDIELYRLLKKLVRRASATHSDNTINLSFLIQEIKRKFPEFAE